MVPISHCLLFPLQSAKAYKRFSSVIPSSPLLNEVQEVQTTADRAEVDGLNGIQTSAGGEVQRSTLVFGRPSTVTTSTNVAPKVQLRPQRTRYVPRPISMPLERLPTPAQINGRNNQNTAANVTVTETIQEIPEPEKVRSSRVSTYYITPFFDTQTTHRRTWDRKYKHYDVTPRTAMIVANLPSGSSGVSVTANPVTTASVATTSSSVSTVFSSSSYTVSPKPMWTSKRENDTVNPVSESNSSSSLPLTLRSPRTLQPPPGTFYKPPACINSRNKTFPNWTTTVTPTSTMTTTSTLTPISSLQVVTPSPDLTSPPQSQLQTQDSTDSAIDPGFSTLSPPQSPLPSSPDDLSPSETKPMHQRLRPRRLQELEHREAHFV